MKHENTVKKFLDGEYTPRVPVTSMCVDSLLVRDDGKEVVFSNICHAGIRSKFGYSSSGKPFVSIVRVAKLDDGSDRPYYDWLVNKSIYRDAFPVKDVDFQMNSGLLLTSEYNASLWLAAGQLARLSTSEYKKSLDTLGPLLGANTGVPGLWLAMNVITTDSSFNSEGALFGFNKPYSFGYDGGWEWDGDSEHLPTPDLANDEELLAYTNEDTAKLYVDKPELLDPNLFLTNCDWGNSQRAVLPKKKYKSNSKKLITALKDASCGKPFYMNQKEPTLSRGEPYVYLWPKAVENLRATIEGVVPLSIDAITSVFSNYKG